MASTVTVRMNTCGKVIRVTANRTDDGADISIESDCQQVMEYASRLGSVTEMDLIDPANGRMNSAEVRAPLTATCLCPRGVIYAASLELGYMSKRLAGKVHSDEIVLDGS